MRIHANKAAEGNDEEEEEKQSLENELMRHASLAIA